MGAQAPLHVWAWEVAPSPRKPVGWVPLPGHRHLTAIGHGGFPASWDKDPPSAICSRWKKSRSAIAAWPLQLPPWPLSEPASVHLFPRGLWPHEAS